MKMIEELRIWFMTIDEGMVPDAGQKFAEWCEPRIREARTVTDVSFAVCYDGPGY